MYVEAQERQFVELFMQVLHDLSQGSHVKDKELANLVKGHWFTQDLLLRKELIHEAHEEARPLQVLQEESQESHVNAVELAKKP